MNSYLSEEEQIEAFKRWWNEHGTKTVAGVVLLSAAYFTWNWYGDAQYKKSQEASTAYDKFVEAAGAPNTELSDEQKTKLTSLSDELSGNFGGSTYVDLANLKLAKVAVEDKDYDKALGLLDQVGASTKNESLKELVNLRKARVLFAQEKYSDALALLSVTKGSTYEGSVTELRGDIYLAQGKLAEAETAYRSAMGASGSEGGFSMRNNILQYKLNNTKVATQDNPLAEEPKINPHVNPHSNPHIAPPADANAEKAGDA